MLVDTQKDLSKLFRECSLYADLTMQKFSQKKKIFPKLGMQSIILKKLYFMETLLTGCLTAGSSQEDWWVFCLIRRVGLLLRCNSSKLREDVWSPRASTVQLMPAELQLGNEAWILQSPGRAITVLPYSRCELPGTQE